MSTRSDHAPEPVLEFKNVTTERQPGYDLAVKDLNLAIGAGELVLVAVSSATSRTPLPDLAQGLLAPAEGMVSFLKHDWNATHADQVSELRSRIGRIFEAGGWLSNLDVDENVTLAQRYHTSRSEQGILEEANALARFFDLPELPKGRPHTVQRHELRRAQWVRALLGEPKLLIMDQPTKNVYETWAGKLVEKVGEARARGAAVLWITSSDSDAMQAELKPTLKLRLTDNKMEPA